MSKFSLYCSGSCIQPTKACEYIIATTYTLAQTVHASVRSKQCSDISSFETFNGQSNYFLTFRGARARELCSGLYNVLSEFFNFFKEDFFFLSNKHDCNI
jgi:hypothetical protein